MPEVSATPAPLGGIYSRLRPVTQADYGWLYALFVAPENHVTWRLRGGTPSPEAFTRFLWDSVLTQYMIVDSTDRAVGLVSAYGFNGMNRTVYLSVIVAPSAARSGMAFEALSLFVEHLFQTWDLRKIYAEAIYENYLQFASGAGRIFVEEGRLSEHEYFNGRYHDFLILALSRDRWISLPQRLRGGFANSESGEQASTSNERELE